MYNLGCMKEKTARCTPKDIAITSACVAAILALVAGGFYVRAERLENKENAIMESEDILKNLGLSGKVPLINNQGYFSYPEIEGIKQISFDLDVRQTDGTAQSMKVVFPKRNAVPINTEDPNVKPAVLFKPENFVEKNKGVFDIRYTVIGGNNPKILKPIGEVAISFSPKDYDDFVNAK